MSKYFDNIGVLSQWLPWSGLTCYTRFQTTGSTFTSDVGNYTFTPTNTGVFTSSGKNGNAIHAPFSNTSTNYSVNAAAGIGITGFPYSVSFWVKWSTGYTMSANSFFTHNDGVTVYGFTMLHQYRAPVHNIAFYHGSGGVVAVETIRVHEYLVSEPTIGNWYHIVGTATGINGTKVYVNNSELTETFTEGTASTVSWAAPKFSFFRTTSIVQNNYQTLDEFGTWNRILSADERLALYNAGSGIFY